MRCLPLDGDDDELALQRAGLEALRCGNLPTAAELAERAGLDLRRAENALAALVARESVTLTEDGQVDGIAGLTVRPTRHRLTLDGRDFYTWCGFDTVGIAAALEADAVASTSCGFCRAAIEVVFHDGVTGPSELWGWLPSFDGDTAKSDAGLRTNFCSAADLFCNRDHLEQRRGSAVSSDGDAHDLEALMELGRATWAHCTV